MNLSTSFGFITEDVFEVHPFDFAQGKSEPPVIPP